MELNIFCGHFSGYVGAHYLNLPTTTNMEHRQSIFVDSYDSFSTVPKETTQFFDILEEDTLLNQQKEEDDIIDDDDDFSSNDDDDDDFSYGISKRRMKMSKHNSNSNSKKDISEDFMEIYQSMLLEETENVTTNSSKKSSSQKIHHNKIQQQQQQSSSISTWSGKVQPIIQPQYQPKRKYDNTSTLSKLQELEHKRKRKQLREYVARATGIDESSEKFRTLFSGLCDDYDDVNDDVMTDVTTQSSQSSWDIESWGDLLASPLHPRGLCAVDGAQDLSQRWGAVENTLVSSIQEESAECIRFFAEECDRVSGFKFVVDAQNAWGRIGESILENIREDFPKTSILCVPTHNFSLNFSNFTSNSSLSQQERLKISGTNVCAALSAKSLSQLASLTIPLLSPFAQFYNLINPQAKKELILKSEKKLSYVASPLSLTLNALAALHTPLQDTLTFLSPVSTSVNVAVAELCVASSSKELRGIMTSVPMSPFAELRKNDVIGERVYSLVQGTRGLGGDLSLLAPSRAWNPRPGAALAGGSKDMLSPLMYFPSRMYGDVFPGCGMTSDRVVQSVATAGIFHSSGEVFKYFDGLANIVREGTPRECLQILLDDSTGTRMEIADELSQIADDYKI